MDSKKVRISVGRLIGWLGLSFCSLITRYLPAAWLYGFARGMAFLAYRLARKQRKIALESLSLAFRGEKSAAEIRKIARDCFVFLAKSGAEIMFFMWRPQQFRKQARFSGKENLDCALAQGKGVILVSAHFGNFPLMMAKLGLEGYKISGIMRPMRDARVEKLFISRRSYMKIKTIYAHPRKACVEETLRALRNNELVFIPMDQNFGTAGVFVNFFGRQAATATGPIILAKRSGAAIVPCFIVRQKDDTHTIIIEPALKLEEAPSAQEAIVRSVQKITDIIESYIRKYPAEWGWIHRRWKSRPNTERGGV